MTRLFAIFYFVMAIAVPLLAAGAGLIPCGTGDEMCTLNDLGCLAGNVINFLLFYLAAPLAIISMLIGGILMITAAGNQNQLERGKSIFYNTIIGIVIAFGAWLIVNLILQSLLNEKFENPLKTPAICQKK
ncbi:MAG: hypothetical protein HYW71_01350 [Candidatus Niyogibacteria bacterium]|nr:hypothetical protein [Candidatus Niyogibacteria bacterium]